MWIQRASAVGIITVVIVEMRLLLEAWEQCWETLYPHCFHFHLVRGPGGLTMKQRCMVSRDSYTLGAVWSIKRQKWGPSQDLKKCQESGPGEPEPKPKSKRCWWAGDEAASQEPGRTRAEKKPVWSKSSRILGGCSKGCWNSHSAPWWAAGHGHV